MDPSPLEVPESLPVADVKEYLIRAQADLMELRELSRTKQRSIRRIEVDPRQRRVDGPKRNICLDVAAFIRESATGIEMLSIAHVDFEDPPAVLPSRRNLPAYWYGARRASSDAAILAQHLKNCQSLRTLALRNCTFNKWDDFRWLVRALSHLKCLWVDCINWRDSREAFSESLSKFPTSRSMIEELTVLHSNWPHDQLKMLDLWLASLTKCRINTVSLRNLRTRDEVKHAQTMIARLGATLDDFTIGVQMTTEEYEEFESNGGDCSPQCRVEQH